jgi:hypothetical protein
MEQHRAFTFQDAWLLGSLFMHNAEPAEVNLSAILAAGDYLNHAIFTIQELRFSFEKLQAGGWIMVDGNTLKLMERAIALREQVLKGKGGVFTLIERTLQKMNKSQAAFPERLGEVTGCDFLTEDNIKLAYKAYLDGLSPAKQAAT